MLALPLSAISLLSIVASFDDNDDNDDDDKDDDEAPWKVKLACLLAPPEQVSG